MVIARTSLAYVRRGMKDPSVSFTPVNLCSHGSIGEGTTISQQNVLTWEFATSAQESARATIRSHCSLGATARKPPARGIAGNALPYLALSFLTML
jgi:hypothetical protein